MLYLKKGLALILFFGGLIAYIAWRSTGNLENDDLVQAEPLKQNVQDTNTNKIELIPSSKSLIIPKEIFVNDSDKVSTIDSLKKFKLDKKLMKLFTSSKSGAVILNEDSNSIRDVLIKVFKKDSLK